MSDHLGVSRKGTADCRSHLPIKSWVAPWCSSKAKHLRPALYQDLFHHDKWDHMGRFAFSLLTVGPICDLVFVLRVRSNRNICLLTVNIYFVCSFINTSCNCHWLYMNFFIFSAFILWCMHAFSLTAKDERLKSLLSLTICDFWSREWLALFVAVGSDHRDLVKCLWSQTFQHGAGFISWHRFFLDLLGKHRLPLNTIRIHIPRRRCPRRHEAGVSYIAGDQVFRRTPLWK